VKFSAAAILGSILAFAGCVPARKPPPPALMAHPHYELANPYEADAHWYYPAENFAFDSTGLASVLPDGSRLTADGEIFDGTALTAAMQTVQLPAVATVTNLENGRQIQVRVNDRGPADPGRLIALSPRAAQFLLVANGVARVRVHMDTAMSHRLVDQIGGPKLDIKTAPNSAVTTQALPPPGQWWLRAGQFVRFDYANRLAAKLAGLGGDVLRSREGRQQTFAVRAGPFDTVAQADAALRRALGAGVVDARITVE
jgi:rare lipoprotein A